VQHSNLKPAQITAPIQTDTILNARAGEQIVDIVRQRHVDCSVRGFLISSVQAIRPAFDDIPLSTF
jgi:hypothetical protein